MTGSTAWLHASATLDVGDTLSVKLDHPANVLLMDDEAFVAYQAGRPFRYFGGWVTRSALTLWPPHEGSWHVVIDLGDKEGVVSASVQVIRG